MKPQFERGGVSPSELIEAGERLFGQHWRKPLADVLGVDVSTLRRWATAEIAVPKVAALAIQLLLEKRRQSLDVPRF